MQILFHEVFLFSNKSIIYTMRHGYSEGIQSSAFLLEANRDASQVCNENIIQLSKIAYLRT